jgi:integrator complex subunit 10
LLKGVALRGNFGLDDAAFGHMMVLMQLDWPLDEDLFMDGLKRIQAKRSFNYPPFAEYVVEKFYLDMFLCLVFEPSGGVELNADFIRNHEAKYLPRTV